jgi:hypothetical protein
VDLEMKDDHDMVGDDDEEEEMDIAQTLFGGATPVPKRRTQPTLSIFPRREASVVNGDGVKTGGAASVGNDSASPASGQPPPMKRFRKTLGSKTAGLSSQVPTVSAFDHPVSECVMAAMPVLAFNQMNDSATSTPNAFREHIASLDRETLAIIANELAEACGKKLVAKARLNRPDLHKNIFAYAEHIKAQPDEKLTGGSSASTQR